MSSDFLSMPRSRDEENFKKHINTFYRKLSLLGVGGHEIYIFLSPYVTNVTYQIRVGLTV